MKTLLVYGSRTGTTAEVAKAIQDRLHPIVDRTVDVRRIGVQDFAEADAYIIGCPTVDEGKMQEDWEAFLPTLRDVDLEGKKVAFFGLGNQFAYPERFASGLGDLHDAIVERGAQVVGQWPISGYDFDESRAARDESFVGLVLDVDNQPHLTDERVRAWCEVLRAEFAARP